jgi:voltage-gated potassium channel
LHDVSFQGLKQIVEQHDTRWGRVFDLVIQFLIVVSLVSFTVETLPDLSPAMKRFLEAVEFVTVMIFTAEYLLRIAVANRQLGFIFSFFGMIDLLAILPFYIAPGLDLRAVRLFRFLRLFRAFKFARYNKAMRRFAKAFDLAKEEILLFFAVALMMIYFSAVGIYYFEHEAQPEKFASVIHSMWWSICTLTTVGYGDVYPVTPGGKVFTSIVMVIGLGIVAVPAGLLASAVSKARDME